MKRPRKQRKVTTPQSESAKQTRYVVCPECEAALRAINGKIPHHSAFNDRSRYCPASECVVTSVK